MRDSATENTGPSVGLLLLAALWLIPALFFTPWLFYSVWPDVPAAPQRSFAFWWIVSSLTIIAIAWVFLRRRTRVAESLASWLFTRHSGTAGLLISLGMLLTLLCVFELSFWGLRTMQKRARLAELKYAIEGGLYADNPVYGYVSTGPGIVKQRCYLAPQGEVIFDKEYTLGANGYRFTPQADGPKENYLALVGCSHTFGLGANDDETLSAYLAAMRPQTHVYNFGFPSWGPAQVLLQMRNGDVLDEVKEARGAVIYTFIIDHMRRILPHMANRSWTMNFPAFHLDTAGKPQYLGRMSEVYPWTRWFYNLLAHERFVQWSGLNIPAHYSPTDYALCAALIEAARDEYCARFPADEYYVLIEPFSLRDPDVGMLMEELGRRGIPVLCPWGLFGAEPTKYLYRRDLHPQPFAQYRIAEWIWEQFPDGPGEPPLPGALAGAGRGL